MASARAGRIIPPGQDIDAVFDERTIFRQATHELALEAQPAFLKRRKGRLGLVDYEKIFCPDLRHRPEVFDVRGIDTEPAWVGIIRPDQMSAHVLPITAHDGKAAFFNGIFAISTESPCGSLSHRETEKKPAG